MYKQLLKTHREFKIEPVKWFEVIDACKQRFGDTEYLEDYHTRAWVTGGYDLYIRFDLLDDSFVTYLGLVCKIKNEQPST